MAGKWTKDCDIQQYLENLFQSGELNLDDKPKDVYDKYTAFRQYSLDVFRKNFNLTKKSVVNDIPKKVTPTTERKRTRQSFKKGECQTYIPFFQNSLTN